MWSILPNTITSYVTSRSIGDLWHGEKLTYTPSNVTSHDSWKDGKNGKALVLGPGVTSSNVGRRSISDEDGVRQKIEKMADTRICVSKKQHQRKIGGCSRMCRWCGADGSYRKKISSRCTTMSAIIKYIYNIYI